MNSWCVGVAIPADKVAIAVKEIPEHLRADMDGYEASRRQAGITMERVYHMATPGGDVLTIYTESERDFGQVLGAYAGSKLPIDRYLRQRQSEILGFDPVSSPVPAPEAICGWGDSKAPRSLGLAFTAPVPAGRTEELEQFMKEAFSRLDELEESRHALGMTRDAAWVNHTPMGDVCCIYLEGPDPTASNERFAASTLPYDVWFKQRCGEIFQIDFNRPLPPIEEVWDWSAEPIG